LIRRHPQHPFGGDARIAAAVDPCHAARDLSLAFRWTAVGFVRAVRRRRQRRQRRHQRADLPVLEPLTVGVERLVSQMGERACFVDARTGRESLRRIAVDHRVCQSDAVVGGVDRVERAVRIRSANPGIDR